MVSYWPLDLALPSTSLIFFSSVSLPLRTPMPYFSPVANSLLTSKSDLSLTQS